MFHAQSLGLPILSRTDVLQAGLGADDWGFDTVSSDLIARAEQEDATFSTSGDSCATGADFICGPKGGITSCRPCDFPQLNQFKRLQSQANRLVAAYNFDSRYRLDVDARIGPLTTRTVALVGQRVIQQLGHANVPSPVRQALNQASSAPEALTSYRALARVAPQIANVFELAANSVGAGDMPDPVAPPPVGTGPGRNGNGNGNGGIPPANGRQRKLGRGMKGALAALGLIGALGLSAAAYNYYRG